MYEVMVNTIKNDVFRGIYQAPPLRAQVIADIRSGNLGAKTERLVEVVKRALRWPIRNIGRIVEVVYVDNKIIGRIIFKH